MKLNLPKSSIVSLSLLFSVLYADGANVRFIWSGGGTGDGSTFTDPGNWGGEAVNATYGAAPFNYSLPGDVVDPSSGDPNDATNIIMQGGGTSVTTHTSAFTFANQADVLIARFGHTFNVQADLDTMGTSLLVGQSGTGGTLNHSAGTFTAGTANLGGGADGTFNYSGTADLQLTSLNIQSGSEFNFTLGASGINAVDISGALTVSGAICVDTNAYDFATNGDVVTLINYGNLTAGFDIADVTIKGQGTASVTDDGSLIVTIPEPTTGALFGIGGLVTLLRRKR